MSCETPTHAHTHWQRAPAEAPTSSKVLSTVTAAMLVPQIPPGCRSALAKAEGYADLFDACGVEHSPIPTDTASWGKLTCGSGWRVAPNKCPPSHSDGVVSVQCSQRGPHSTHAPKHDLIEADC